MGAAFFYHLTRADAAQTLHMLLPKAQGAGWRVELRTPSAHVAEAFDAALWAGDEAAFLAHGVAGGAHDALQPILLTTPEQPADAPCACVMSVQGAEIAPEEVQAAERVCILFDGADPEALAHARGQWSRLTKAGIEAQYWAQDPGWIMKAKHPK